MVLHPGTYIAVLCGLNGFKKERTHEIRREKWQLGIGEEFEGLEWAVDSIKIHYVNIKKYQAIKTISKD